ncbi:MAG: 6-phosphogluconolactonase [Dysgonomonas sp.]
MIKDVLKVYENTTDLSEGFTRFILNDILKGDRKINIALSGGTTPKVVFDYWAAKYKNIIPWDRILFFWGDERCVPPDNNMNNYAMTKEHLFDKVDVPNNNIFRIHGENEPEEEAVWYSKVLQSRLPLENDVPVFDLIILGLGDDGHTASIFPQQINLWDSPKNCVVAEHPESKMKRVSVTGKIINSARNVVFLATGDKKSEKVQQIIKHRKDFTDKYPAARVAPKNQQLYWFLDKAAAELL